MLWTSVFRLWPLFWLQVWLTNVLSRSVIPPGLCFIKTGYMWEIIKSRESLETWRLISWCRTDLCLQHNSKHSWCFPSKKFSSFLWVAILPANPLQVALTPLLVPGVGMWLMWTVCSPNWNNWFCNECFGVPRRETEDYSYLNCPWKLELTVTQYVLNDCIFSKWKELYAIQKRNPQDGAWFGMEQQNWDLLTSFDPWIKPSLKPSLL